MRFSDEKELIISCLKTDFDEEHLHYIQSLLLKKLDWQNLLTVVMQNQISSLFYHKILQAGGERFVPRDILQELRKSYHAISFQNRCYEKELKKILLLFDRAMVDVIVLKGAALIERVWQNAALRSMADIDILIRKQDVDRVEKLMSDSGYIINEKSHTKEWYREYHHHLVPFYNPENEIIIEIHTNILSPSKPVKLDVDKFWACSEPITISDSNTKILCLEHLFIHLCLHLFAQTSVGGIKNLADIAKTLDRFKAQIDWKTIESYAAKTGISDYIYYALHTVNNLSLIEVDCKILSGLRNKSSKNGFEDYLLKKMITRTILYDDRNHLLPIYYHKTLFSLMFDNNPIHRKIRSFNEFVFPREIDSPSNNCNIFLKKTHRAAIYFNRMFNLASKFTYKLCCFIANKIKRKVLSF